MYKYPIPPSDMQLGAIYNSSAKCVHFSLWAPSSFDVQVNLYKEHVSIMPDYTILAEFDRATGVWSVDFDEADPENFAYDFSVRTVRGINNCLDPYAKSMTAFRNDESIGRGVIVDLDSKAAGKSFLQNFEQPLGTRNFIPLKNYSDAIIYEVSIRDFTSSPDAKTKTHGTYLAFIEKIPYLKSLGITHIQLMPVLNFYFNDELSQHYENSGTVHGNNYNWGYDPHSYFSPEGWYSSAPADAYARIRELRQLISCCHKAGLAVIFDVVYNHMATTDFLDKIVPGYYFRSNEDGTLKNNSGCGNDTASEMPMMHRLIVDSLIYWTKEYGVDGFRFDLMGLIESSAICEALKKCRNINPNTIFIGEGWKMYDGPEGTHGMDQDLMESTTGVSVFSDEYRDILKAGGMSEEGLGFITGLKTNVFTLFRNCMGDPQKYFTVSSADNVVNYIACHDGLTLHDCIAHNCRLADSNPAEKKEIILRIKLGNFFVLTSRGIAFLHSGQESGRTKPDICGSSDESVGRFVRNSYDSSDNINGFVWTLDNAYSEVFEYTKLLCAFRKEHAEFRSATSTVGRYSKASLLANLPHSGLVLGYTINEFSTHEQENQNGTNKKGTYVVLVNASKQIHKFTLLTLSDNTTKAVKIGDLTQVQIIFDTSGSNGTSGVTIHESPDKRGGVPLVVVDPLSAAILYIK
jgi:type I pullulanase